LEVVAIAALAIPEVLHVSYKYNFMDTTEPSKLKAAVHAMSRQTGLRTIRFHSDAQCFRDLILNEYTDLAYAILNEKYPPYRSDVCRLWYLKEQGGYYFDTDMVVVKNIVGIVAQSGVSFASAVEQSHGGIHNGFLAVDAHHYIVERAFEYMDLFYQKKIDLNHIDVGPGALWMAVREYAGKGGDLTDIMLFQENNSPPTGVQTLHKFCNIGLWLCSSESMRLYEVKARAERVCDQGEHFLLYAHSPGSRQCPSKNSARFRRELWRQYGTFCWIALLIGVLVYARNPNCKRPHFDTKTKLTFPYNRCVCVGVQ